MNILSNFNSSGKFSDTFSSLFSALGLCSLLRRAGFKKREGYGASVSSLLFMVLSSCFYDSNKTIYGNYTSYRKSNICTSKSSLYRFLSNCRNNWRKLILLLSERVISKVSKLSDSDRKFCFVIDDSSPAPAGPPRRRGSPPRRRRSVPAAPGQSAHGRGRPWGRPACRRRPPPAFACAPAPPPGSGSPRSRRGGRPGSSPAQAKGFSVG